MSRFRPIDRATDFLLPPSIQEGLPEAHLARYVVEVVEQLDLSALERASAGRGYEAYPLAMWESPARTPGFNRSSPRNGTAIIPHWRERFGEPHPLGRRGHPARKRGPCPENAGGESSVCLM